MLTNETGAAPHAVCCHTLVINYVATFRERERERERVRERVRERIVYAAKYTGEFNIQFESDNSKRSRRTMQEIVPRNKIEYTCRPRSRATPQLLLGPQQRFGIFMRV
ncbi:hypothetical protein EVAR_84521_1 [Eumeta japonica]|uniref:Uncharacterized protein n=1 Tax=Eumeta variegata TaxID=151549 RepID=A0A4C1UJ11_EUMVA|nr:hypothetical protein EVAR_84521_1 [Eumeta japonica]